MSTPGRNFRYEFFCISAEKWKNTPIENIKTHKPKYCGEGSKGMPLLKYPESIIHGEIQYKLKPDQIYKPYQIEHGFSQVLSEKTGSNVFVKFENRQHTGAFKVRGSYAKLLTLPSA